MKTNFSLSQNVDPTTQAPIQRGSEVIQLDRAPIDKYMEVVEVPLGRGVARSLAQLGLSVSERLRVRSAAPWGGPVLVEIGGTTVAIGRGLARRIMVRPVRKRKRDATCLP